MRKEKPIKVPTSWIIQRICPICQSPFAEYLHRQEFVLPSGYGLPSGYDLVSCNKCGLVYADTLATQDDYHQYYELLSKYESSELSTGSGVAKYDGERLRDFAKMISEYFPDRSMAILDVGCANGGLLLELRKLGYANLMGLDISAVCVQNVRQQGIPAVQGTITSQKAKLDHVKPLSFELIILTGVLEHIYALDRAAEFISHNLKEQGHVFLRVPDAAKYSVNYTVPFYYFDIEHINHFSHNDLENLFRSYGFETVVCGEVEFIVSAGQCYPDIYAILKKSNQSVKTRINYSDKIKASTLNYLNKSRQDDYAQAHIKRFYESQEEIVIWGAGMNIYRLLAASLLDHCNILAFIDNDTHKQGRKLSGKPIVAAEFVKGYDGVIVLSSVFHNDQLERQLRDLGCLNTIVKL